MKHMATRLPAILFLVFSLMAYSISPWVMLATLFISWGFWRVPVMFPEDTSVDTKNKKLGFVLFLILIAMSAFSYLMVPLFHQMCHALDIGGKVHAYNGPVDNKSISKLSKIEAYPVYTLYSGVPISVDLAPKSSMLPLNGNFQHIFVLTNKSNANTDVRIKLTIAPSLATNYIKEISKFNNQVLKFKPLEKKSLVVKYNVNNIPKDSAPSIAMAYTFFKNKH